MKIAEEEKREVLNYLSKYKLMSLGTYYRLPWAASVYFLFDENFNFYFISSPKTKHCMNIVKNPKVSITVADSGQKASENKMGFQARGEAKIITSMSELKQVIKAWNKRHIDTPPIKFSTVKKIWKSKFYKIKLTDVQMFDENQTEDKEVRFWKI